MGNFPIAARHDDISNERSRSRFAATSTCVSFLRDFLPGDFGARAEQSSRVSVGFASLFSPPFSPEISARKRQHMLALEFKRISLTRDNRRHRRSRTRVSNCNYAFPAAAVISGHLWPGEKLNTSRGENPIRRIRTLQNLPLSMGCPVARTSPPPRVPA